MFFYDGLACPHCDRLVEETDDIVGCPVCGAPHHRDCWNEAGGCSCADTHGTEEQWSREKAKEAIAAKAAAETAASPVQPTVPPQSYAPTMSAANERQYSEYAPFHAPSPYVGVAPDTEIEGETVRDLAAIVRTNVTYYIPRFEKLYRTDSRVSWNWLAFLLPSFWLLHRKQYLAGGLMLLKEIFFSVFQWYFNPINRILNIDPNASAEVMEQYLTTPEALLSMVLLTACSVISMMFNVYFGLFGTRLYMRNCLQRIRKAKQAYPEGYQAQLSMIGGTTVILGIISSIGAYFIAEMIYYFLI